MNSDKVKRLLRDIILLTSVIFLLFHGALPHVHQQEGANFTYNQIPEDHGIFHVLKTAISSNLGEDHLKHLLQNEGHIDIHEISKTLMNYNPVLFVFKEEISGTFRFLIFSDILPSFTFCRFGFALRAPPALKSGS